MESVEFQSLFSAPVRNGVYKAKEFQGRGVRLVKMNQLFSERRLRSQAEGYELIDLTDKERQILLLKKNDLLFSRTSVVADGVGKCSIIAEVDEELTWDSNIIRVRLNPDRAYPQFYFFFFNSPDGRDVVKKLSSGAAVTTITGSGLAASCVPLPPLPVQKRIAGILSAYDELIENSQRRIKILESMARALYREWFIQFRFPGHENHPRVASPLGEIPQGWEVKKLVDVVEVNRTQINARTAPNELHYIDISSVSPGQIDSITTYAFADAPGRARRVIEHGDMLWSCVRPNRRSYAQVMHPEPNTIASTGFAVLTAKKVPYTFLYFATTTDDFVAYLTNNATGAAYPAVTATTFEKAELLIPSAQLLKKFGDATIPMAEEVYTLQRKVQNLRCTRDLLLPRLLSGLNVLTDEINE